MTDETQGRPAARRRGGRRKKPYVARPRVLSRERLEAIAGTCSGGGKDEQRPVPRPGRGRWDRAERLLPLVLQLRHYDHGGNAKLRALPVGYVRLQLRRQGLRCRRQRELHADGPERHLPRERHDLGRGRLERQQLYGLDDRLGRHELRFVDDELQRQRGVELHSLLPRRFQHPGGPDDSRADGSAAGEYFPRVPPDGCRSEAAEALPRAAGEVYQRQRPESPGIRETSRFTVTVRLVNPTPWPITFSNAGSNVVTANVPGGVVLYGGNAQTSQGTLVAEPTVGAAGNVVRDPGVVAAGSTQILAYEVRVTPTEAATIHVTGTPTANGTSAVYFDETGNTTQVDQTRNTLGPLCQLSVNTDEATLALLGETRAVSATPGVLVEWETVSEAGTAGFEVYRIADGERTLVHSGLLEASLSAAGARYRLHDREVRPRGPVQYEIVEVETDGGRRSHGLVTFDPAARDKGDTTAPTSGYSTERRAPEPLRSATRAPMDQEVSDTGGADTGGEPDLEAGFGGELAVAGAPETASLRIETSGEGLTFVSWSSVAERLGITQKELAYYVETRGIAVRRHDGSSAAWTEDSGGLLFWALPFDSLFARGSVYWLTLEKGPTMATRAVSAGSPGSASSFQEKLHVEQDLVDVVVLPISPSADYWLWKGLMAGRAGPDRASFPVTVPGLASGSSQLTVGLQGSSAASLGRHHVRVLVNGVLAGEVAFAGYERVDAAFEVSAARILDGANTVTIEALLDAGTSQSIVYLDSFDVVYPRRYDAQGSASFVFEAAASSPIVVSGLPAGAVSLYDITDPSNPALLSGFFGAGAGWRAALLAPRAPDDSSSRSVAQPGRHWRSTSRRPSTCGTTPFRARATWS